MAVRAFAAIEIEECHAVARELLYEASHASLLAAGSVLLDDATLGSLVDSGKGDRHHLCGLFFLAGFNGFFEFLHLVLHGASTAVIDELFACGHADGLFG